MTESSHSLSCGPVRDDSTPIHVVEAEARAEVIEGLGPMASAFAAALKPEPSDPLVLPDETGGLAGVVVAPSKTDNPFGPLYLGELARKVPPGTYHLASGIDDPVQAAVGWALGLYRFDRYSTSDREAPVLTLPDMDVFAEASRLVRGVTLTRDLINSPANDMGPAEIENATRALGEVHSAKVTSTIGDDLIEKGFPLIHAVGRASDRHPRLIDLVWGDADAPKVTLVGKGVAFDTGGLDLKPPSGMLLMKKDMGGAANVLGLASMLMEANAPIRLRVLIPAVENSVSANAFRPGDVLPSRKGLSVEIGNTDAEGRLVLADALALADEESPDLLIDMATLTGAARVALGPDLPPFYTRDDRLAASFENQTRRQADPAWRLPLWGPYDAWIKGNVGDIDNAPGKAFAGSITAALFLARFVGAETPWMHFDVFGWAPESRPHGPRGGEAQCIRALDALIRDRYSG